MSHRQSFRFRDDVWPWLRFVLVGALAIATGCIVVYTLFIQNRTVPVAREPYTASVSPTPSSTPKPVAVFIGDSYTHGTGASSPATRWTTLVAQHEGWVEDNEGLGGTGFVHTAGIDGCGEKFCDAYKGRLQKVIAEKPQIVVVAGGQNDFKDWVANRAGVTAAIDSVFSTLHSGLPDARLIAVGPSTTGSVNSYVIQMDAAVQAAAAANGATYVSLISPPVLDKAWVLPDGGHVNDLGHAAIAARVEAGIGG